MCPSSTVPPPLVLSDESNAAMYALLASAARFSAAIKNHSARLALAPKIWKIEGSLRNFVETTYQAAENAPPVSTPLPDERVESTARSLYSLYDSLRSCYEASRLAGLTNAWFAAASLNSILKSSE
jgi:hypothetical protein